MYTIRLKTLTQLQNIRKTSVHAIESFKPKYKNVYLHCKMPVIFVLIEESFLEN